MRAIWWWLVAVGCGDNQPVLGAWGSPTPIALDVQGTLDDPSLSSDELELYVNVADTDIYEATRPSRGAPWSPPVRLDVLASGGREGTPGISADGLTLYFTSSRDGSFDIWMTTRTSRHAPWSVPHAVPELNSPAEDFDPTPSADDLSIVFTSARDGTADLFLATRASRDAPWGPPAKLSVSGPAHDAGPMLSSDGLTLYFDSSRDGTNDLFEAHRARTTDPFDPPAPITELDTFANEDDAWISLDSRRFVFSSDRSGVRTLWEASR